MSKNLGQCLRKFKSMQRDTSVTAIYDELVWRKYSLITMNQSTVDGILY
jgi:hypothetical protein